MGDRTVLHLHRIIGAALRQGRKWGWVDRNVSEDATAPTPRRAEMFVPAPHQVVALITEAGRPGARSPELATIIILAALTRIRRGELCGLRWSDVDWNGSALMVRRSIWETSEGTGVKDPKTHQVRRLLLGEHAMGVLAGRLDRAQSDAEAASVPLSPDGYVFSADPDGASPLNPGSVTQAFGRLCKRMVEKTAQADPPRSEAWPYHFHSLRHYAATELFAAGLNPKTIADRLGHADASITLRVYTANTDAQAQAAADALEAGLSFALPSG